MWSISVSWITYRFRRGSQVHHELFIVQMMSDDRPEMTFGQMNSEDAVNLFLEGKKKPKRCRSKHDEVEESMKDVWKVCRQFDLWMTCVLPQFQLFVELNELVDNSDDQILRISNQMSNTENYVSSGNEHLEMAIHLKRSADKKKAILMTMVFETKSQPTSYTSWEMIRTGDEPGI